ncbi:MAG: DNA translocase FtsK [Planctomycetota bacterium]
MARGSKASPSQSPDPLRAAVRPVLLLGAMAVWVFAVASLLAFDPGDAPFASAFPANSPTANVCGPVGAALANGLMRFFGLAAWALTLGLAAILVLAVVADSLRHAAVRVVGLVVACAGLAGLLSHLTPTWLMTLSPYPDLPGGSLGLVGAHELSTRFGSFGTALWLGLVAALGLVVSFDRWLIVAPVRVWQATGPLARGASRVALLVWTPARVVVDPAVSIARSLWKTVTKARPKIRRDDLEGEDLPDGHRHDEKRAGRKKPKAPKLKETAGGLGGGSELDLDDELEDEIDTGDDEEDEEDDWEEVAESEEDEYNEEEDDDLPGAPQVFSEADIRDKVAKLPLRFSGANKSMATDEDLAELQNEAELEGYQFPGLDLLEDADDGFGETLEGLVREQAERLETALRNYSIEGEVVGIESGPAITLYDVRLAPGTKVSKMTAVASDVARSLKAVNIRIVTNQKGKDTVGVEVPNPKKERVRLKELMSQRELFGKMRLPMFLGKDASGEPLIEDLTKMPHMLIAGTTGSGKSVCMNTIIMSWLYTKKPNELKMVLVDPKMVEMSQFKDIPHLMCPVVTEMSKAAAILEWACKKMDERYELLADAGCRDISGYNELEFDEICERMEANTEEEKARIPRRLPYMVFIIDELADLMMTAKEVEGSIIRIAQKARAVGIHLILATQRPQANVVTGLIKSNMPSRISFKVRSGMDSRIVLDHKGGELLLGQGDMLFLSASNQLVRAQGTLVDDHEIRKVCKFVKTVAKPSYERQLTSVKLGMSEDEQKVFDSENHSSASLAAAQEDPMFDRAVEIVLETKRGSVSLLQRRLAIGYTRASRLIDLMGIAGIISDHKGSVARDVLITPEMWGEMKAFNEREMERMRQDGTLPGQDIEEPTADAVENYERVQGTTKPLEHAGPVQAGSGETGAGEPLEGEDIEGQQPLFGEPKPLAEAVIEEPPFEPDTPPEPEDETDPEVDDEVAEQEAEEEADEEEELETEDEDGYEYVYVDEDGNEIDPDQAEEWDEDEEEEDSKTNAS